MAIAGIHLTEAAARQASTRSRAWDPRTPRSSELHDCFSANELITYQGLGPVRRGQGGRAHPRRCGHLRRPVGGEPERRAHLQGPPVGSDRPAQCSEITWQLRGDAEARQVDGARVGIQHNLGLAAPPWSPSTARTDRSAEGDQPAVRRVPAPEWT